MQVQVARITPVTMELAVEVPAADVKAEVDICCTSSNALEVVESLGADRVTADFTAIPRLVKELLG